MSNCGDMPDQVIMDRNFYGDVSSGGTKSSGLHKLVKSKGGAMTTKPKVLVRWHDAIAVPELLSQEELGRREMWRFESIGYLVSQDEHTTVIASEYTEEYGGSFRNSVLIPTKSIISIWKLRLLSKGY